MRVRSIVAVVILLSSYSWAQHSVYAGKPVQNASGRGIQASILVCTSTATGFPCSPTATIYTVPTPPSNPGSGTPIAGSTFSTDANGNFSFGCDPGLMQLQITVPGLTYTFVDTCPGVGSPTSGLTDPGSNGILKRTALNITAIAGSSDIIGTFSGCSGTLHLAADGSCHAAVLIAPTAAQNITGAFPLLVSDPGSSIGIGTSTIISGNQLEIHSNTQTLSSWFSHVSGLPPPAGTSNGPAPILSLTFSRGTQASPAAVQGSSSGGDPLGEYALAGFDSSVYANAASIQGLAVENWTASHHGASLQMFATLAGTSTQQEVFRFALNPTVGNINNFSNLDLAISQLKVLAWGPSGGGSGFDIGLSRHGPGVIRVGNGTFDDVTGNLQAGIYSTGTNCSVNSASPAACGSASSGSFVVPTTTTSYTVNSTSVGTHSRVIILPTTDASDLPSAPTCNAPAAGFSGESARSAGVSFTFTLPSTTGTTCWVYWIVNQ
jgi:hypothetical protein